MNKTNERKVKRSIFRKYGRRELTMKIVFAALFTSLCVIFNSIVQIRVSNDMRLSFNLLIYFFTGAILGGPLGFVVGFLSDLIGWVLYVDGTYNILLGISSGLFCLIPGLFFTLNNSEKREGRVSSPFILISITAYIICYLLCTVGLNSIGLWLVYGYKTKTLFMYMVGRAGTQLPNTLANLIATVLIGIPLKRIRYFKEIL